MDLTYYNDNDHFCCEVLRKNIACGNLPEGHVDERDIRDVRATDLAGYRHIHLFAGIGGFPLGLSRAGVSPDLRIITGGFPCQDISQAGEANGKRSGLDGTRSGLWSEFYRLICELRPRYVLVENVAALLQRGIDTVLGNLAASGYDAEWQVLQASSFGVAQRRARVFIVAYPYVQRSQSIFLQPSLLHAQKEANLFTAEGASPQGRKNTTRILWQSEPNVGRVADGIPARVDRLRALGNAIVPQCAEYIGRCMVAREQQMEEDNDVA